MGRSKVGEYREVIEELMGEVESNPLVWGKWAVGSHFDLTLPQFHAIILENCLENRWFAVASPRESAKSTILAFLYPLWCICFKVKHFILIVSNTWSKAAGSLDTIKAEVTDNEKLSVYGIEVTRDAQGDSIFRHRDGFETRVLCKGTEQIGSVRGEKFRSWRPDLIIGDDIEDDEMVRNPERRIKLQEEFDQALIPAGDKKRCQYIFIGTILHDDSQMAKLVSLDYYTEYRKLLFRALNEVDGETVSLWPEKWSVSDLRNLEREKPDVFAKEYQNDPVSGMMSKFKKEDFRYWRIEDRDYVLFGEEGQVVSRGRLQSCKAAIACDLAWNEKREADYTVIMPGLFTPDSEILIDNYVFKKGLRPNEIEEILFSLEERLRKLTSTSVPIGFEKTQLDKVMSWLLRKAMRERNHFLYFKDLMWDSDKITRIVTRLQPRYAQHSIFHKRNMGELEHQLLRVPSGTHDDLPDALQGLVQLFNFPKKAKKETKAEDPGFDKLRKFAQNKRKQRYVFGKKVMPFPFPTIRTPL